MSHDHDHEHQHQLGHVTPIWLLLAVFIALLLLTALTVGVIFVDLGGLNVWIALAVAAVKATLVALFFMHLWWDRPFNAVVFLSSMAFLVLFIGLSIADSTTYQPNIIQGPPKALTAK